MYIYIYVLYIYICIYIYMYIYIYVYILVPSWNQSLGMGFTSTLAVHLCGFGEEAQVNANTREASGSCRTSNGHYFWYANRTAFPLRSLVGHRL